MNQTSYIHFQKAGKEALQEKRFETAKVAFDQALSRASQDPRNDSNILNTILDFRLEAQLRLKDVDAALKDAQTMIRHDRADSRGYLRCGQLCRLKNDYNAAQKWYRQGLKHASKTNRHYASLEMMSSKTAGKAVGAAQRRFQDPLVVLPMDIIHMISDYLDLRQATICLRVSKLWQNILLAIPSIWKTLDLLGTRRDVSLTNVRACIRRLQNPPTTVRLHKLKVSAVSYLRPYVERWKNIEHLTIKTPGFLSLGSTWSLPSTVKSLDVGEKCPIYFSVVDEILRCCEMLQEARFDAVRIGSPRAESSAAITQSYQQSNRKKILPGLTHLVLNNRGPHKLPDRYIEPPDFFCDFPNITVLSCTGFGFSGSNAKLSTARSLRYLYLEDCFMEANFTLPSSLEVLTTNACPFYRPLWVPNPISMPMPAQQVEAFESLSNLSVLMLQSEPDPSPRLLTMIKKSPSATLTGLDIAHCGFDLADFVALLEGGKLSKLSFLRTAQPGLDDSLMQCIAAGCPKLEHVELYGSTITGVSVKELFLHTAIKTLRLSACLDISSDAISWARAKGVKVVVNRMDGQRTSSGRRVRYD